MVLTVPTPAPIRELDSTDIGLLRRELLGSGEPAVLRGLVSGWPAVGAARSSASALVDYLRGLDSGTPVDAIMTAPEFAGRIFYREGLNGFNFVRNRLPLTAIVEQALRYSAHVHAPAVAVQSASRSAFPDLQLPTRCRSRILPPHRASGSAMRSPLRRISMSGSTSAA